MYCSIDSIVHAECVLTVYLYGCILVRMCSVLYISVLYAVFRSLCSNLRLSGNSGELRCVLAGYSRQRSTLLHWTVGLTMPHF